jgi:hypothetical protein
LLGERTEIIRFNGRTVPRVKATEHAYSELSVSGTSVFDGIPGHISWEWLATNINVTEATLFLDDLQRRGVSAIAVNNSDGITDGVLRACGLRQLISGVADCGALGVNKPDRRLFAAGAALFPAEITDIVNVADTVHGMHGEDVDPVLRRILCDPLELRNDSTYQRFSSLIECVQY